MGLLKLNNRAKIIIIIMMIIIIILKILFTRLKKGFKKVKPTKRSFVSFFNPFLAL